MKIARGVALENRGNAHFAKRTEWFRTNLKESNATSTLHM